MALRAWQQATAQSLCKGALHTGALYYCIYPKPLCMQSAPSTSIKCCISGVYAGGGL